MCGPSGQLAPLPRAFSRSESKGPYTETPTLASYTHTKRHLMKRKTNKKNPSEGEEKGSESGRREEEHKREHNVNEWLTLPATGPKLHTFSSQLQLLLHRTQPPSHSCVVWSRRLQGQKKRERELYMTPVWSRSGEQRDLPCGACSPGASGGGKHLFLPHQPWGPCPPASPDTLPAFLIPLWDNPIQSSSRAAVSSCTGISGSGQAGNTKSTL